jgi:hypothetical protein
MKKMMRQAGNKDKVWEQSCVGLLLVGIQETALCVSGQVALLGWNSHTRCCLSENKFLVINVECNICSVPFVSACYVHKQDGHPWKLKGRWRNNAIAVLSVTSIRTGLNTRFNFC